MIKKFDSYKKSHVIRVAFFFYMKKYFLFLSLLFLGIYAKGQEQFLQSCLNISSFSTDSSIVVEWTTTPNTSNFSNYNLYYQNASPYQVLNFVKIASFNNPSSNRYELFNLTPGNTYYFYLAVENANGAEYCKTNYSASYLKNANQINGPKKLINFSGSFGNYYEWTQTDTTLTQGYYVYIDTLPNPTTIFDSTLNVSDTSVFLTNLDSNKVYFVRVAAKANGQQISGFSNEIVDFYSSSTFQGPQNVNASVFQGIKLSFDPPVAGLPNHYRYLVRRGTVPNNLQPYYYGQHIRNINDTVIQLPLTPNNIKYYYSVSAVNFAGYESDFSSIDSIIYTDTTAPEPPVLIEAIPGDGNIFVQWKKYSNTLNDFQNYQIFVDTTPNATTLYSNGYGVDDTSEVISGLQNNINYYIRLKTIDISSNSSAFSNELFAMPIDTSGPGPISNFTAIIDSARVNLTFTPTPNLDNDFSKYRVYKKLFQGSYSQIDSISTMTITSYLDVNVVNNQKYEYKIVPVDSFGNEGINNPVVVITPTKAEQEPNDAWYNANFLDSTKVGFISGNINPDFYKFQISQPTQVTLKTDSVYFLHPSVGNNISNTYLDLISTNGNTILSSNDNDPSNGNFSRIVYNLPAAGTYYVRVSNNNTAATGYYSISISKFEPDPYEPNGNIFNATQLADTQVINNLSIFPLNDRDFFKFSTQPNSRAQVNISNPFYTGTIRWYNRQNQTLQTNVANNSIFIVPDTGYYFFSYEIPTFTLPTYILDFKIIPPISYTDSFRINEVKYSQNGVQFIEIYNLHNSDILGTNFKINELNFTFPQGFRFSPQAYTVLANDSALFFNKYGFYPHITLGSSVLNFNNQTITLLDSNSSLIDFVPVSNGTNGFPQVTDSNQTIELLNFSLNNNLGSSWKLTDIPAGTPGHATSFPRNYYNDIFEPNNTIANAKNIQFRDSINLTISEFSDTADYFNLFPRVFDTLNFINTYKNVRCNPKLEIFSKSGVLLLTDSISPLNSITYVVQQTDTLVLKISPINNQQQFVFNEGNFDLKILVDEHILISPWTQNFEQVSTTSMPNGFRIFDLDNNGQQWEVGLLNVGLNTSKGASLANNATGNNDWMILPPTQVRKDDIFSFWARASSPNFPEKLKIYIGNKNAIHPNQFTTLIDSVILDSNGYKNLKYDITSYQGQVVRFAIRNVSVNKNLTYLDNIKFSPPDFDASVRGIVRDFDSNQPLPGVRVSHSNISVFSDSSGYYEINQLPYGNIVVNFDKINYTTANYTFGLQQGDTVNFNPKLAVTSTDTLYYNPFDRNLSQGFSINISGSGNWRRTDTVIYSGQVVSAFEDDSMLVFGGNLGYNPSTTALYTFKSGLGFDFTPYRSLDLKFALNQNIDTSDFVFLIGNGSFIININSDTIVDSLDRFTGNTNGWVQKTIPLDYLNNFDDLELGFLFGSNQFFTSGFGTAIDDIYIIGQRQIEKPAPTNFNAQSFIQDTIKLFWQGDTSKTDYFSIYRSSLKSGFKLIGTTTDTFYFDTAISNNVIYNYYVIANYPFGESDKSNNSVARAGIPNTLMLPYSHNFNSLFADTLPLAWGYDVSINNPWLSGDSATAQTFNAFFRGKSRFLYGNFFSFNVFGDEYESILTTPWFNLNNLQQPIILSFDYAGDNTDEHHILVYKDNLASDWKVLDTLDGNFFWKKYRYDISNVAAGKPYFQLGYRFIDQLNKLNVPNVGFAIDNFNLQERKSSKIYGVVSSETGNPLPNASVEIKLQSPETWNLPNAFLVTTDSLGRFKTPNNSIFQGIGYQLKSGYFGHDSTTVNNQILTTQDSLQVNLTLQLQLSEPSIISLNNDSMGYPIIGWRAPKNIGEISYDDGVFSNFDSLTNATRAGGILIETNNKNPYTINQIAVYTKATTNSAGFVIRGFPSTPNGLPNTSDTLFSQIISNTNFAQGWNFITLNQLVDTSRLCLVLYGVNSPSESFKVGFSPNPNSTASFWNTGGSSGFYNTSEGILLRAYINVGNSNFQYTNPSYSGTFNLFRLLSNQNSPVKIDSNLTSLVYTDTSLSIGDTAFYYLTATNSFGESDISNIVSYIMKGLPFAKVGIGNMDIFSTYTNTNFVNSFSLTNIGLYTLSYSTQLFAGLTPLHQIDTPSTVLEGILNSQVYCFNNPLPTDTTTIDFFIENRNTIGDNHQNLTLSFPQGVYVINSTNIDIFNTSRFLLSGGQTGNGANLTYTDPTQNQKGELYPFEGGKFSVTVYVDSSANLPIKIGYLLEGDSKNKKQDTLTLAPLPFTRVLNSATGQLNTNGATAVGASFNVLNAPTKGGRFPMYYQTQTNDNNLPKITVPFYINFDPARGVFRGLVTDDVNNDPLPNVVVTGAGKIDTTNAQGWFYISDVPVGTYEFSGQNVFYSASTSQGTILNHNDTSTLLITLSPNILKPENLTARGRNNSIELAWNIENPTLYYNFEQPVNTPSFEIKDWTTVDGDGDGFSWDYYSAAPNQGFFSVATTANPNTRNSDWLISKQVRVEETNANLSFFASPQDFNFSEERFVVRVSTTNNQTTSFTDSLYSFQFAANSNNWQNFTIPLNNYLNDSIYVAIHCVSNGQFKLKIDDLTFNSVRYIEAPLDSGIYSFKISRSKNNSPNFTVIDSISFSNDTITYIDSTAMLDTLYTYYVNSVIPQINQISDPSNFASFRLLSKDIGPIKLGNPITGRNLTNQENVEIEIENLGTDTIYKTDTFNLSYAVNSSMPVTQQFSPGVNLGPGQKQKFTFTNQVNLQQKGNYSFIVYSELSGDDNLFNDTLQQTIVHRPDTVTPPNWNVNPANFQFNMALTAEVFIIDTLSRDSADILAAFSNNQVRGLANINFVPSFGKWVAQITVYSNLAIENINFKIWDASRDSVFDIIENYTFINNQIYGTLNNPERLNTISGSDFYDIGVTKVLSPDINDNSFTNSENLAVELKNFGSLPFASGDSVEVFYRVQRKGITLAQGSKHHVFTTDFLTNDTVNFNLNRVVNMNDTGLYQFTFYTNLSTDIDKSNDTLLAQALHNPVIVPVWSVDPSKFQFSSFITARVLFDNVLSTDEDDIVAAIVNNQIRGVANIEFVPNFSEHVIQMAIYSNANSGEIIKFRAFDYSKNQTLWVEEEYKFSSNAIWGSLLNPERLNAVTGYNSVAQLEENGAIILFPNPTNGQVNLVSKNAEILRLEVINSLGQIVESKNLNANYIQFQLKNNASGLYKIKVQTTNGYKVFNCMLY